MMEFTVFKLGAHTTKLYLGSIISVNQQHSWNILCNKTSTYVCQNLERNKIHSERPTIISAEQL